MHGCSPAEDTTIPILCCRGVKSFNGHVLVSPEKATPVSLRVDSVQQTKKRRWGNDHEHNIYTTYPESHPLLTVYWVLDSIPGI